MKYTSEWNSYKRKFPRTFDAALDMLELSSIYSTTIENLTEDEKASFIHSFMLDINRDIADLVIIQRDSYLPRFINTPNISNALLFRAELVKEIWPQIVNFVGQIFQAIKENLSNEIKSDDRQYFIWADNKQRISDIK